MVIQFEPLEERLVRADEARRRSYVERVQRDHAAWKARRISVELLCERAGEALRAYASETLDALFRTARPGAEPDDASQRLRDVFNGRITRTAVEIRDVISDSSMRHAVAQRLQEQLLRAEAEFHSPVGFVPSCVHGADQPARATPRFRPAD